jgi:hypothetical protein
MLTSRTSEMPKRRHKVQAVKYKAEIGMLHGLLPAAAMLEEVVVQAPKKVQG